MFNVPMGDYKNPLVCDENNLHAVSEKLQNVKSYVVIIESLLILLIKTHLYI